MDIGTNRLEGIVEREEDEQSKLIEERDPDPNPETEDEAEPPPAPSWMDEDSKKFNLRIFQEWKNQRSSWKMRHEITEGDPLLDSRQGYVI